MLGTGVRWGIHPRQGNARRAESPGVGSGGSGGRENPGGNPARQESPQGRESRRKTRQKIPEWGQGGLARGPPPALLAARQRRRRGGGDRKSIRTLEHTMGTPSEGGAKITNDRYYMPRQSAVPCMHAGVWWTEALEALGLTIIVASDSGLRLGLLCSCAGLLLRWGDGEMPGRWGDGAG